MFDRVLDMPQVLHMAGFWIWRGSEYIRALNIPGLGICQGSNMPRFWICQGSEYTRALKVPGFRLHQRSECSRVLNMPLVLDMPGFWVCLWFWIYWVSENGRILIIPAFWISLWFWIFHGSKYTKVLNMPGFWIHSEYARFLNITRFWICQGSVYNRILKIPGFWIRQGYIGFWIHLNNFQRCLIMPKYAKICANVSKLPKWFLFYISPL